jgi:hypothetical protein
MNAFAWNWLLRREGGLMPRALGTRFARRSERPDRGVHSTHTFGDSAQTVDLVSGVFVHQEFSPLIIYDR